MRSVLNILATIGLLGIGSAVASANTVTLPGLITDSGCSADHSRMMEKHKDAKMTEKQCTLGCVKAGGQFVFLSGDRIYNITNQDFAGLTQYAAEDVRLTGEVDGPTGTTITVTKVEPAKP